MATNSGCSSPSSPGSPCGRGGPSAASPSAGSCPPRLARQAGPPGPGRPPAPGLLLGSVGHRPQGQELAGPLSCALGRAHSFLLSSWAASCSAADSALGASAALSLGSPCSGPCSTTPRLPWAEASEASDSRLASVGRPPRSACLPPWDPLLPLPLFLRPRRPLLAGDQPSWRRALRPGPGSPRRPRLQTGHCPRGPRALRPAGAPHPAGGVSSASGLLCPRPGPDTQPSGRRRCPGSPWGRARVDVLHKLHQGSLGLVVCRRPGVPQPEGAQGQEGRLQEASMAALSRPSGMPVTAGPVRVHMQPLAPVPQQAGGHGEAALWRRSQGRGDLGRTWAAVPGASPALEQPQSWDQVQVNVAGGATESGPLLPLAR